MKCIKLWPSSAHRGKTAVVLLLLFFAFVKTTDIAFSAGSGHIVSLSAAPSNNPTLGVTITISSVVEADANVQNSNLFFQVYDPNAVVIASNNGPTMPSMNDGDQVSYSWQINNAGFTLSGTYIVTICWSPGNSQNCNIATAKTTFFSVPTLGPELILVAVALIAGWFWVVRRKLQPAAAAKNTP